MKKLFFCAIVISLLIVAGVKGARSWQTASSLQVGTFTLNVPAANPAVTVQAPTKAGTMALLSDVAPAPGTTVFAGQITVNGSATFSGIAATPVCSVTPRFTTTSNGLTVTVIDYVCTAKNN
jgi:hypothetical protein